MSSYGVPATCWLASPADGQEVGVFLVLVLHPGLVDLLCCNWHLALGCDVGSSHGATCAHSLQRRCAHSLQRTCAH